MRTKALFIGLFWLGLYGFATVFPDRLWGFHHLAFLPTEQMLTFILLALSSFIIGIWLDQKGSSVQLERPFLDRWTILVGGLCLGICFHLFPIAADVYGEAPNYAPWLNVRLTELPADFNEWMFSFSLKPEDGRNFQLAMVSAFTYLTGVTYEFGFNGMEKDDEVHNVAGSSMTTYFRQYDPRLGRWKSPEPKPVAWESLYASFRNNPVYYADPNGDWVKGAGFFRNLFNSDAKILAKDKAKATGGIAFKDGKGWTVNYATKETVDLGNGPQTFNALNVEHYRHRDKALGKTFGNAVVSGLEAADGFNTRIMGTTMHEGEDWVQSFKAGGEAGVSFNKYGVEVQMGFYATGENSVGVFAEGKYKVDASANANGNSITNFVVKPKAKLFVRSATSDGFSGAPANEIYGGYDVKEYATMSAGMGGYAGATTYTKSLITGKESIEVGGEFGTTSTNVQAGVKFETKLSIRSEEIDLHGH